MVKNDKWELFQLGLLLLNSYPSNVPTPPITTIGSIGNSRWIAKIICEQNIALHSAQRRKLGMFKSNFEIEQHSRDGTGQDFLDPTDKFQNHRRLTSWSTGF